MLPWQCVIHGQFIMFAGTRTSLQPSPQQRGMTRCSGALLCEMACVCLCSVRQGTPYLGDSVLPWGSGMQDSGFANEFQKLFKASPADDLARTVGQNLAAIAVHKVGLWIWRLC